MAFAKDGRGFRHEPSGAAGRTIASVAGLIVWTRQVAQPDGTMSETRCLEPMAALFVSASEVVTALRSLLDLRAELLVAEDVDTVFVDTPSQLADEVVGLTRAAAEAPAKQQPQAMAASHKTRMPSLSSVLAKMGLDPAELEPMPLCGTGEVDCMGPRSQQRALSEKIHTFFTCTDPDRLL
ncbi:hypothetical protein FNF28_05279 [Cafeteria roenbergensis]|uniref:Uncharacterized protein n=1 Tax=Cafeteria roenbergensis TaxID=33653 RepID=A0A5A8D893_CAFRO|nr:hypothetical protein FNF28_05279 [Cafeteria roenbergensis]